MNRDVALDRYALVDLADWLKNEGRCLDVTEIMHLAVGESDDFVNF